MKLTILLMTVALLQVNAGAFSQKVTIKGKNLTLKEVFSTIRKQTGYNFFYSYASLQKAKRVTLDVKDEALTEVLSLCFAGQPLSYSIEKETVFVTGAVAPPDRMGRVDPAAELPRLAVVEVKGTVLSDKGEPLVGVSVNVKGSNQGTFTDASGKFSIKVDKGATLVLTIIGYKEKDIEVTDQTTLNIRMNSISAALSEVTVIGYGTRTQGALTGAISTVSHEVFEDRPLNNTYDALEGAIPGVTITKGSGQPGNNGGQYTLQVRGNSSINGNAPLILIDGVPSDFSMINPADIAQITVLKDAAAAIYGARAADGVILVTTKKGKKGAPDIMYTVNFGVKTPTYLRKTMNTLHFAEFLSEGLENVGLSGFPDSVIQKIKDNAPPDLTPGAGWNYGLSSYPAFYGSVDWNKVVYKNSSQELHNLSISGGGDYDTYLLSFGYNQDNGIVNFGENNSKRYNMRLNYDLRPFKGLSIETRTTYQTNPTIEPSQLGNALTNVPRLFPYQPVYNPLGEFYGYQGYQNPAEILAENGTRKYGDARFNTNIKADYEVIPGLKVTGQAAVNVDYYTDNATYPTYTRYNWAGEVQDIRSSPNSAYYTNNKSTDNLYQVYVDYNKNFGLDHRIDVTAGTSLEQISSQGQTTWGYNFPTNNIFTLDLADRTQVAYANFTGNLASQALDSYFGRFSYSFKNRVFLDVTGRADGSSKFSPSKRWSEIFPSAALAYNISEEKFIKDLNVFDLLKLRTSWGKMGNQDIASLGLFDYIPLITIGGVYPIGSPAAGLQGAVANPASATRTWETIRNENIGIDLAALRSRLSFSFDVFNKTNEDMLVNIAVPATFGGTPPSSNQGRLVTKGFETSIGWKDHIGDFRYGIALQVSDNKNKLVSLQNTDSYVEGLNGTRQGYSTNSIFGYVYEGIIKNQQQLTAYKQLQGVPADLGIGDVMLKDVDGDGKISEYGDNTKAHPGDMVYLGNTNPRYTFSSTINVGYKQFDLQVFLQGVGKRMIQYSGNIAIPNTFFWPSLDYYYGKTWSVDRPNAQYPRYIPGSVGHDDLIGWDYHTSSLVMQNAAYLRVKVLTVGYNLPPSVARKVRMKSARVYFSGQDLFTICKGTLGGNFDPEDQYQNEGTYPFNRVYSMGLSVKF